MGMIDDDGRLLGKINIIDFLIILAITFVVTWGLYKLLTRPPVQHVYVESILCLVKDEPASLEDLKQPKLDSCGQILPYISENLKTGDIEIKSKIKKSLPEGIEYKLLDYYVVEKGDRQQVLAWFQLPLQLDRYDRKLKPGAEFIVPAEDMPIGGIVTALSESKEDILPEYRKKQVKLFVRNIDKFIADQIDIGDKEESGSKAVAEIKDLDIRDTLDADKFDAVINADLLTISGSWFKGWYKDKRLDVDSLVKVELPSVKIEGKVVGMGSEARIDKELVPVYIKLLLEKKKDWVSEFINIGDTKTDNKGRVITEVIDKEVRNSQIEVITESGEVYKKLSPVFNDIELGLKIKAFRQNDELILYRQILRGGNNITLYAGDTEIKGEVLDIEKGVTVGQTQ